MFFGFRMDVCGGLKGKKIPLLRYELVTFCPFFPEGFGVINEIQGLFAALRMTA